MTFSSMVDKGLWVFYFIIFTLQALEILDVVRFESPDIKLKSSQFVSSLKYSALVW